MAEVLRAPEAPESIKMGAKSELEELLDFLASGRLDLQMLALDQVLGLTGSPEGLLALRPHLASLTKTLCSQLAGKSEVLCKDAAKAMVNITADAVAAKQILETVPVLVPRHAHCIYKLITTFYCHSQFDVNFEFLTDTCDVIVIKFLCFY